MSGGSRIAWRSLAGKYAVLVGLLISTAGAALGATSYMAFERSLRDRYLQNAEQLAQLLAEFTADYLYELRIGELRLVFREIQARRNVLYTFAVDGAGSTLAEGTEAHDRLLAKVEDPLIDIVQATGDLAFETLDDAVHMAVPVQLGSNEIGVVRLGLSLAAANQELSATRRTLIGITIGFVVVALITTFILLHNTGRQLNQLRGSAQAAAGGRYDMRVRDDGEWEVRELAQAFNAMLDAIGEKTERINRLAYFDPLTGASNRTRFEEMLEAGLEQCDQDEVQLAVMFFDLDRFKQINDSLGHAVGDEILCGFYRIIEACRPAEKGDGWSMVARLGGDEFTMLIAGRDVQAKAAEVAERILQSIRQPMPAGGQTLAVGTSIGIACYPHDARTKSELMQAADLAMYAAKDAGRNTYRLFKGRMRDGLTHRFTLEAALREAVRAGGFELHYQPIVSLETSEPVGVEALLRWRNADGLLIAPDVFLPVAEDSGLIFSLGNWVMREALTQARCWRKDFGRPVFISVNLSARQLEQVEFVDGLLRLLLEDGHDHEAGWLTLEITETAAMTRPGHIAKTLAPLRAAGVRIAIDDFGTGYSSLSYLQEFAFDALKIDRSFVSDLLSAHDGAADIDRRRQTIVGAIVEMAHALDYRVIAEGIETQAQWDLLRTLGCEFGQGFFFAKPLGASDTTAWLKERNLARYQYSTFTRKNIAIK